MSEPENLRPTVKVVYPDGQSMEATGTLDEVLAIQAGWFNESPPAVAPAPVARNRGLPNGKPRGAGAKPAAAVDAVDAAAGEGGGDFDAALIAAWAERPSVNFCATKLRQTYYRTQKAVERLGLVVPAAAE